MEEEIRQLEEDIKKRTLDLKVAHTRLETRTYRPHIELCRDQVPHLPWSLQGAEGKGALENMDECWSSCSDTAKQGNNVRVGGPGKEGTVAFVKALLSAVPSSLQAQFGLTDEVQQLEGIIRALQQKRTESQ